MKKKIRKITVDGKNYQWRAVKDAPGLLQLRICRMSDTTPWAIIRGIRFDDPFYFFPELAACDPGRIHDQFQLEPLTPVKVAELIRRIPEAGGDFHNLPCP